MNRSSLKDWRWWIISIIGILCIYYAYYKYWYPQLIQAYSNAFIKTVSATSGDILVEVPMYIADPRFVEREVKIRIENTGETALPMQLSITGTINSDEDSPRSDLPNLRVASKGNKQESTTEGHIDLDIPQHSIAYAVFWISLENGKQGETVNLDFYKDRLPMLFETGECIKIPYDLFEAFKQSAFKLLLISPFSNLFLSTLALGLISFLCRRQGSVLFALYTYPLRKLLFQAAVKFGTPIKGLLKEVDLDQFQEDVKVIVSGFMIFCTCIFSVAFFLHSWLAENKRSIILWLIALLIILVLLVAEAKEKRLRFARISSQAFSSKRYPKSPKRGVPHPNSSMQRAGPALARRPQIDCSNCGESINDPDAIYCKKCGERLESEP